jgi:AmmeMemoRadiSam system protein A
MNARLSAEGGAALLALGRAAIEDRLLDNGRLAAARATAATTPGLDAPRACFVTLKIPDRDGALRLRGCIGSTEARLPARDAVVVSALDAAFADPRFPMLTREELPGLVVVVSALTPVTEVPGAAAIVASRDGVVLECEGRRSLFLPEVAGEQGWSTVEMLEHLARKAGLPATAWRRARLFTFQSERFGETEGGAARIRRS